MNSFYALVWFGKKELDWQGGIVSERQCFIILLRIGMSFMEINLLVESGGEFEI